MAGRKKSGEVSSVYVGGFGPVEFEGKHRKRTAEREWSHLEDELIRYAVAYRLEEYKQAGKLSKTLIDHTRADWFKKIRKSKQAGGYGLRGDVLAKLRGTMTWVWRGPPKHPNVYYTDLDTKFMKGTDWLHGITINGKSLWQILEKDYDLKSLNSPEVK